MASSLDYHLRELQIAQDPQAPGHCLPPVRPGDRAVLDIGCGIGQTLACMGLPVGCRGVGIDMDAEAVAYGQERFAHLELACGTAEQLPYADASFDLVVSRVSLCYTHIAPALAEVQRVLRPGGRLWCTLHDWRRTRQEWWRAARQGEWKDLVFRSYVFANGLGFAATGRALAFPGLGRCEFFQTESGMRRALARAGLRGAAFEHGRHFICTAEK